MNPPAIPTDPPTGLKKQSRHWFQHPLAIIGFIIAGILGLLLLIGAIGATYVLSAKDFTLTSAQRETLFTAPEAGKTWHLSPSRAYEDLTAEKYLDGSVMIDYYYDDQVHDEIYINCTISEEPTLDDAKIGYPIEWAAFEVGTRLPGQAEITLTKQDHLFSWGDASKFVFQETEGSVYGFALITRKGKKTYFLDVWGLTLDNTAEIEAALLPVLERFEKTSYRK